MLKEIDPHSDGVKFAERLDCVVDKSTNALMGFYNSAFGPFMWPLPQTLFGLSSQPDYWYAIATFGLLNGQVFDKFKVLQNKLVVDPLTLTLESILGNQKLFKLAMVIKSNNLVSKDLLESSRSLYKSALLDIVRETFRQKVDNVYEKLFK